jgi:hypothetical protein
MTEQRGDPGGDDARRSRRDESVWAQAARDDAESDSPAENGAGRGTPRPDQDRTDQDRTDRDRTDRDRPARERTGRERRQTRPRQVPPSSDVLSEFQRWLLRNSAKTMRKEITGQVRRTFSGSGRQDSGDVWDTATTEIPLGVGEAPECQWCPICRAARRMRDSGPSIGDHLSTAGDAVAAAVQDALGAVDSVLSRASGQPKAPPPDPWAADGGDWTAARDSWAAAHGARIAGQEAEPSPEVPDEPADEVAHGVGELPEGPDEPADEVAHGVGELPEGPDEPADEVAHEVSQQPEGPDEPDNRG